MEKINRLLEGSENLIPWFVKNNFFSMWNEFEINGHKVEIAMHLPYHFGCTKGLTKKLTALNNALELLESDIPLSSEVIYNSNEKMFGIRQYQFMIGKPRSNISLIFAVALKDVDKIENKDDMSVLFFSCCHVLGFVSPFIMKIYRHKAKDTTLTNYFEFNHAANYVRLSLEKYTKNKGI